MKSRKLITPLALCTILMALSMFSRSTMIYSAEEKTADTPLKDDAVLAKVSRELTAALSRHAFLWVGLTSDAAGQKAAAEKKAFRVVSRDGKNLPVTRDFLKGRLNVYLWQGRVLAIKIEGSSFLEGCTDPVFLPYLGCEAQAAQAMAQDNKLPYRTVSKNGESMMVTADFNPQRINAHEQDGKLVAVSGG
ncbi:MAG: hypothetical protein HRU15_18710 [Planctomycetes bacterium]|nr:hypothetical protein [Planctomycetota bacterium]